MLLWCFKKKVSFCGSAWLISGSYWIIVPCLQLIKATLTDPSSLAVLLVMKRGRHDAFSRLLQNLPKCLELVWLCQSTAGAAGWANTKVQTPPPQAKQGLLLSLSGGCAGVRLGERHWCFKVSLPCSVPVWFLADQPDPGILELECTVIHTRISLHRRSLQQKSASIGFGWLVSWSNSLRWNKDYLEHLCAYFHFGKNYFSLYFFHRLLLCSNTLGNFTEETEKITENNQPHKTVVISSGISNEHINQWEDPSPCRADVPHGLFYASSVHSYELLSVKVRVTTTIRQYCLITVLPHGGQG